MTFLTINDQIEDLTTALATGLRHSLGAEVRATIRYLILLLGKGRSVCVERIAAALKQSPDKVATTLCQLPNIELDEHDNVVGAGLPLRPTPHHYGRTMFTWRALDALMFPGLFGQQFRSSHLVWHRHASASQDHANGCVAHRAIRRRRIITGSSGFSRYPRFHFAAT